MSGLGEWDDDVPVYDLGNAPVADVDEEPDEPVGPADVGRKVTAAAIEGLDVASIAGSLVASAVTAEIHRQVQKEVAPIVTNAVAVLTPDRLDALREAATSAAEAELNPPPLRRRPRPRTPRCSTTARSTSSCASSSPRSSAATSVKRAAPTTAGRRAGGSRPRRSPGSKRCGEPGEHLRMDASTGTSVWLRDHADHHLGVLMSPTGPWALSKDLLDPASRAAYEAPPEGLFPDVRDG